jgi:hypothetical protein
MTERERVALDPAFSLALPPGWAAEADEEEGVGVFAPDGVGLLHLVSFEHAGEEAPDPAEELYAFLEEQGVELEEDEVEDVELAGGAELSLCEYLAEPEEDEEDGEEATFWLNAVATAPGLLVFCSYSCPAGEEEAERDTVRAVLSSLALRENP